MKYSLQKFKKLKPTKCLRNYILKKLQYGIIKKNILFNLLKCVKLE